MKMKRTRFTETEIQLIDAELKKVNYNVLPAESVNLLHEVMPEHSKGSINYKALQLRKYDKMSYTVKDDTEDDLPITPNSIADVCRLANVVKQSVDMFLKCLAEFKIEYSENMDLLNKSAKLRKAAEDIFRQKPLKDLR